MRWCLGLLAAALTVLQASEGIAQSFRNNGMAAPRAARAIAVKPQTINQAVRPRPVTANKPPRIIGSRVVTGEQRRPEMRDPRRPGRWHPRPVIVGTPGAVVSGALANPPPGMPRTSAPPPLPRGSGLAPPPPGESRFVPNEVILTIAAGTSEATLTTIARRNRMTRLESYDFALTGRRMFRWRIDDGRPVAQAIRALQADARLNVLAAQPNYLYSLEQQSAPVSLASGDPAQYALAKLRLPEAHALARGESVTVAVIDSAVDTQHPDLAGVVVASHNTTGTTEPPHPHGTAMAAAIAARGHLLGTAPAVKILAVQAFTTNGATSNGTTFSLLKAIDWAGNSAARIINMSFAGPPDPQMQAMLAAARAKGIALIAAAGNAGPRSPPLYPAADPNVIAVTALDAQDQLFAHASRGRHIAVAAPGVEVLVAAPGGTYKITSGTSVAAAQISGVVALMLERNPGLAPDLVRKILMATARDLGPRGHDDQFGAGLADAYQAVMTLVSRAERTQPAGQ
jgi:subtilisin family serine protease